LAIKNSGAPKFLDAYKKHLPFNRSIHSWEIHRLISSAYSSTRRPTLTTTRCCHAWQFQKIALPILTITGQYDGDELGALTYYRDHLANASPQARAKHFLIIGPWDHPGTRTPTDEVAGVKFGRVQSWISTICTPVVRLDHERRTETGIPSKIRVGVLFILLAPGNSGANGEWKIRREF